MKAPDEWLAGYPWYKFHNVLTGSRNGSGSKSTWARPQHVLISGSDTARRRSPISNVASPRGGGPHAFQRFYDLLAPSRFRFFSAGMLEGLGDHDPYAAVEPDVNGSGAGIPLTAPRSGPARIHLPGQLLSLKGDRIAMSQSVEMRYPFLDNNVFDFLAEIDPNLKLKGLREKYLLRRVAEKWLPKSIAWRPKGMFRAPLDGFFLEQRLPYVDELLSEEVSEEIRVFRPQGRPLVANQVPGTVAVSLSAQLDGAGSRRRARDAALAPHLHRSDARQSAGLAIALGSFVPTTAISTSRKECRKAWRADCRSAVG